MKILQELPDMQQANDFNDNIGVPRVSELPEKIWAWFFVAPKREEGIIDGFWCSEFDRKETEYVRADVAAAQLAEARNAALDEAIEAITFEAEGRKKQMDAHEHDAVQHERFRIGELQSRLNVKNVDALKTEPSQMTSTDIVERVARAIHCYDGRLPAPWCDDLQSDNFWIGEKETAMRQARAAIAAMPSPDVGWQPIETAKDMEPKDG